MKPPFFSMIVLEEFDRLLYFMCWADEAEISVAESYFRAFKRCAQCKRVDPDVCALVSSDTISRILKESILKLKHQ